MGNKQKHLEFIQMAINRMASNLFLLKGWTVTLIAALFALAAKDSKDVYFLIAYLPALMFWVLDGFFLSQERCFRSLYDCVRKLGENDIDFSMDTRSVKGRWDDSRTLREKLHHSWVGAMFSWTLLVYYGGLLMTMWTVMYLLR